MSGKMSRNKGQRGERQLTAMLSDELGIVVKRNLSQTRAGGADCVEIPNWKIEIKFQETLNLNTWWQQTLDQTKLDNGENAMLFFRKSRQKWQAMTHIHNIGKEYYFCDATCILDFETACMIIRESL